MKYFNYRPKNWKQLLHANDPMDILNKENPYISKAIRKQNRLSHVYFKPYKELRKFFYKDMMKRIIKTHTSVLSYYGDFVYKTRFLSKDNYPRFFQKRENPKYEEFQLLLDCNLLALSVDYFSLQGLKVSKCGRWLLYATDTTGSTRSTLFLKHISSGKIKTIHDQASGNIVFGNGGIYFVTLDQDYHPNTLWFYSIVKDQCIKLFHEKDKTVFMSVDKTSDESYILLELTGHGEAELYILENSLLALPDSFLNCQDKDNKNTPSGQAHKFKKILSRFPSIEYASLDHAHGYFYLLTNARCENFHILKAPSQRVPTLDQWEVFLPNTKNHLLYEDMLLHQDFIVIQKLDKALPSFDIIDYKGHPIAHYDHHEPCYDLSLNDLYNFSDHRIAFQVSSPKTPPIIYELSLVPKIKRAKQLQSTDTDTALYKTSIKILKRKKIPYFDSTDYATEFHYVKSYDGQDIPVSLFYKKMSFNQPRPAIIDSYGAYGYSESEGFSSTPISLVNKGFVYVAAHVRGGMDMGYAWYTSGKKMQKLNTFFDVISVAQWLIDQKRTTPQQLGAIGRSAGGMTIGYLANTVPHLFKVLIAIVPFVDCLTTMQDESLPLTPPEWNEWGNPITDPLAYAYIKTYSPMDHVTSQAYPALYSSTGLTDSQVGFWEPLQWISKIQACNTGKSPIILDLKDTGHQGKSGRYKSLQDTAKVYAFILSQIDSI